MRIGRIRISVFDLHVLRSLARDRPRLAEEARGGVEGALNQALAHIGVLHEGEVLEARIEVDSEKYAHSGMR